MPDHKTTIWKACTLSKNYVWATAAAWFPRTNVITFQFVPSLCRKYQQRRQHSLPIDETIPDTYAKIQRRLSTRASPCLSKSEKYQTFLCLKIVQLSAWDRRYYPTPDPKTSPYLLSVVCLSNGDGTGVGSAIWIEGSDQQNSHSHTDCDRRDNASHLLAQIIQNTPSHACTPLFQEEFPLFWLSSSYLLILPNSFPDWQIMLYWVEPTETSFVLRNSWAPDLVLRLSSSPDV